MKLRNRADYTIAHGALTNSKRPASFVDGIYPTHSTKAKGCYLWDENGKKYIDFICGLGTNLFGYGNPSITTAVVKALHTGAVHSLSSEIEVQLAERIKERNPHMERMRFLKSGSEGCSAAVRIARAFTGRDVIITEGYSGWHDDFISDKPPARGIPERTWVNPPAAFTFNVAAYIVEPVITDMSKERIDYLKELIERAHQHGSLVIFDETITAYRFPRGSFTNWCGLQPDITIMGKAVAGGLPLSIVGGRADIMNTDYFVSSTWAGDRLACAAALAASNLLQNDYRPDVLWRSGQVFLERFNSINPDIVKIEGYPTRGVFVASDLNKSLFFQEACEAGILFGSSWFYNSDLHKEIEQVISLCTLIIKRIQRGEVKLKGTMIKSPFSMEIRDAAKKQKND